MKITQNIVFEFWHFPLIFVLLKVVTLVTLIDQEIQVNDTFPLFSNTVAYSSRFFESSDESMYSMLAKIAKILYGQFYHCVQLHMLTLKIGIYRGGNF